MHNFMKKFYTLILAAAALSASANVGFSHSVQPFAIKGEKVVAKEGLTISAAPTDTPRKAESTDEWTSLGMGTYTEDLLSIFGSVFSGQSWAVEIQESTTTPGYYRLVNPYGNGNCPFSDYFVSCAGNDLYIHTENDVVYMEWQDLGVVLDTDDGTIYAADMVGFYLNGGNSLAVILNAGFTGGTFSEGNITFEASNMVATAANLDGAYYANTSGAFLVALPGAKDYSISVTGEPCVKDNYFSFEIAKGADVAAVKVGLTSGDYHGSSSFISYCATNGTDFTSSTVTVDGSSLPAGRYTVGAAALDAEGNEVGGATAYFYVILDETENWKSLGTTKFPEVFVSAIYSSISAEDIDVEIQENIATPGLYRLVNPYANWSLISSVYYHSDHNHYITINATNASQVYIQDSPIGISMGDGYAAIKGYAELYLDYGYAADDASVTPYFGTLADNVLSFPEDCVLFCETGYSGGAWKYYGNVAFTIAIPEQDGIDAVALDDADAPVEYFNLQGIRISEPVAGSVVIRRQGSKVEKVLVK